MTRAPTSERYPRLPCRDITRQSKAEPLDAERRSIGAGRLPSNGAPQGDQGEHGRDLERGTAWQMHRLQSSRRHRGPSPLSTLTRLVPGTKQEGARASKYFPRRRTAPTDELSHPMGRHSGAPGGCTTPTDHVKGENRRNTLWPNPMTRPKPRGLLSGTMIRDTLIGVLRSP
jgi:hypothetical protein